MSRRLLRPAALAAAATAAVGLVGAGAGTAVGGPHALSPTPHVKVKFVGKHMKVSGPTSFAPGRVALTAKGGSHGGVVEVGKLKAGYTFKHLRKDLRAFNKSYGKNGPSKSGLRHLRHAIAHVTLEGGLVANRHHTARGTVNLTSAGSYVVWNDSGSVPRQPHTLTLSGSVVGRATPNSTATVKANSKLKFSGAKKLPAKGTITFKNTSRGKHASPHLLELNHVKKGTTHKQVAQYINSGAQGQPSFARKGSAATDAISPGQSMTLSYKLPKGEYVELCFFPDPHTGMPHAFMGMWRIVHLK